MFGLLGKIFGSQKALNTIVSGASSALDKLIYTEEEKAGDAAASRAAARGMVIKWMESTKGQNLARRLLAVMISTIWLLQYIVSMALDIAVIFISNQLAADRLAQASMVIGERAESMNGAMMLILGFYFAAPHMGAIATAALQKFGKNKSPA